MSVNAIQRRHRWLMTPLQWLGHALSPDWWACVAGHLTFAPSPRAARAGRRLTRLIAFDTTALASGLNAINPLVPLRRALLRYLPPLRWVDWQVRKFFWTLHWCSVAVFQGWPRRAPIPERESPIGLVAAPDTYPDFRSPTLTVPDGVPCAEASLGAALTVQIVHLLQDLYPVVSTYQAPAHADPQVRFDRAYTWLYRLTC